MDLAQACVTYRRNMMKWLLKLLCLRSELQPHKTIKTSVLFLTTDRKTGSFKFIPAAFPGDPKDLYRVVVPFSGPVWGSGCFRWSGVQTAIWGALLFTLVQT